MEERAIDSADRSGALAGSGTVWVPIDELYLADSPRLAGQSDEHVRMLAESGVKFPPIIVQAGTNRIIDGLHRVRAAQLRGADTVEVRYFSGDDRDAFVLAVKSNVEHGLPLSLGDRKAAAVRILGDHPQWSNRAVAAIVGLSPKTVGALRTEEDLPSGQVRIGRDGRVRPLDPAAGRARAREILTRDPSASLRMVSTMAGVSVRTVRDVRNRLRQAGAPDPDRATARTSGEPPNRDPDAILRDLRGDPSLRFTESGRLLLGLLSAATLDATARERIISDIPAHCLGAVARLAAANATVWQAMAAQLGERWSASA